MPTSEIQDFQVSHRLSRRKLLMSGLLFIASSSVAAAKDGEGLDAVQIRIRRRKRVDPDYWEPLDSSDTMNDPGDAEEQYFGPDDGQGPADEQYYDPALLPPAESEIDYPVKPVDRSLINSVYWRQVVEFDGNEDPGTVVVDPRAHFLYHVLSDGHAMRYGVGVGRAGFSWSGNAEIRMKRRWPRWVPPKDMVDRDERAQKWANGQPGGPGNPLGARALYLYSDGKDTLYRIHGTNEPKSIGKSVSSGCVRMLNEDVADLFDKVEIGTQVIVRSS
jgi:lipoprotein-anchoring transpeptidase ErfK/SrfK